MRMKRIYFAALLVVLYFLVNSWAYEMTSPTHKEGMFSSVNVDQHATSTPMILTSSGAYLASRAAQHRNDWKGAATFLEQALQFAQAKITPIADQEKPDPNAQDTDAISTTLTGPNTLQEALSEVVKEQTEAQKSDGQALAKPNDLGGFLELKQRVLIFRLGSGHYDEALKQAQDIIEAQKNIADKENVYDRLGFAQSVLVIEGFRNQDFDAVASQLDGFSKGAVSDSLKPLFNTWLGIATKKADMKTILRQAHVLPLHAVYALEFAGHINESQMLMERFNLGMDSAASKLSLAVFYARNDKTQKASALIKELVDVYPDDAEILELYNDSNASDAIKQNSTYRLLSMHMNSLNHALAFSLYDIALNHLTNGSEETALLLGQLAYGLVQDVSQVNFLLADILTRRENYEQSLSILESISENDSGYVQAVIARSEIYSAMEQKDKAYDVLQKALILHPDVDLAYALAGLFRSDEKYTEALTQYDKVEELAGGTIPDRLWSVHYYRGIIFNEIDDWDQAELALLEAKKARPENPFVLNYLGYSWVEMHQNIDEALLILQRALDLKPDSGFITDSVGWAYFKLEDYDKAITYLERAAELMPYDPEVNDHLGDAYWKVGRKLEAYYQWNRAIDYVDADNDNHVPIVKRAKEKMETGL